MTCFKPGHSSLWCRQLLLDFAGYVNLQPQLSSCDWPACEHDSQSENTTLRQITDTFFQDAISEVMQMFSYYEQLMSYRLTSTYIETILVRIPIKFEVSLKY